MLFQNEPVFCLVITMAFSSCFSSFDGYEFQVNPVKKCPLNKEAWNISSARMNCNKTHGYHCVPNKGLTSLIEFCYPRGGNILFEKGNCLELAGTGILNHVSCNNTFSSGCPDSFYYSNKIYEYPACLAINTTLRCFVSDTQCIGSRLQLVKQNTTRQKIISEKNTTGDQSGSLTTQYNLKESTVQNIIDEWNIMGDIENLTQIILKNSTEVVEQSSVERNGTGEQTDISFTKNSSENYPVVVIILSILLFVSIIVIIVISVKRNGYLMTRIKRKRRKSIHDSKIIEMQTNDNLISSHIIPERYAIDRSPPVSNEISHREGNSFHEEGSNPIDPQILSSEIDGQGLLVKENETPSSACSTLLRERDSSTQSTPRTFSSQSNKETDSDSNYEDVNFDIKRIKKGTSGGYLEPIHDLNKNKRSSIRCNHASEDETYGGWGSGEQCHDVLSQNYQQMDRESDSEECSSECSLLHNQERSNQNGPQLFSPQFQGQIDKECEYEENSSESKSGSSVLIEVNTNFSKRNDYVVSPQIPANKKTVHHHQLEYSNIDNQTCSNIEMSRVISCPFEKDIKLRTVVMNKERTKPVVVITEKESKQTKEVATSERINSNASSHFTKKSEEKKRAVQLSDKNKGKKKRGQMRQRKHRIGDEEWRRRWEKEQENKRQMDVYIKCLKREIKMLRRDRDQLEKEKLEFQCIEKLKREQFERDRLKREQEDKMMLEQLRTDRDRLEKEKLELQCLEKLKREQFEPHRLEREQEDKMMLEQLRFEAEQKRIKMKRLYSSCGGRDEFWINAKRPIFTENQFTSKATFISDRDRDQVMDCRKTERSSEVGRAMNNFNRDSRPEKRRTLGFERERERSSTQYDWRNSSQREQSDTRYRRDRDRRRARTKHRDSRHEWTPEREDDVMETSFSEENWQEGDNSSSLPNETNLSQIGITYTPGLFDSSSNSQSNWASSVDRSNIESSWSAPKMRENRMLGFQPQDCGTWNNLGLQADTLQQRFGTEMTSGQLGARGQVMSQVSVPQSTGMVLTNTSLAGGQTVPRFDAYNSMQTQFRRY